MNKSGCIQGIVVAYKEQFRGLLFRELRARWGELPVLCQAKGTAALLTDAYPQLAEDIRRNAPPVFLQHLHPFSLDFPVTGKSADLSAMTALLVQFAVHLDRSALWTVQGRVISSKSKSYVNSELTRHLAQKLIQLGFTVAPQNPQKVLSVTVLEDTAFLGVSDLRDNISRWSGGVLFYQKSEETISRAAFKLEEAIESFQIGLSQITSAVDLGAAPGGWTYFLSKKGIHVDAVDPARLDSLVTKSSLVHHYPMTAQAFARRSTDKKYDLLVNDMKMDAVKSAEIILDLQRRLKPDGLVICTLKLPEQGFVSKADKARRILEPHFEILRVKHLYYNRSELTLYAQNPK